MKPDLLTHVIVRQDGLETVVVIVHGAAAGLAKTRAHVFAELFLVNPQTRGDASLESRRSGVHCHLRAVPGSSCDIAAPEF
jgi:hypothetical protein